MIHSLVIVFWESPLGSGKLSGKDSGRGLETSSGRVVEGLETVLQKVLGDVLGKVLVESRESEKGSGRDSGERYWKDTGMGQECLGKVEEC